MKRTKTFKLGEWAIGGIIRIDVNGKIIRVSALDWDTKEVVSHGTTDVTDEDWHYKCERYLENLSTFGYANKMMEWVHKTVKITYPQKSSFEKWVYNQNVSQ